MRDQTRLIIGVFVVLLGTGLLLDQTGLSRSFRMDWIFSNLWPLFLLVLGVSFLVRNNIVPGIILTFLGVSFLSSSLFNWNVWGLIWPMFIIGAGLMVLFRGNVAGISKIKASGKKVDASAVFWGADKKVTSENYEGGDINCIFGGVEYDLSHVKVADKGAVLNVTLIFGGIEIWVPKNVEIINNVSAVVAGVEDQTAVTDKPAGTITITGTALFGGVEVKN